jgi:hypothetical protein
MGLTGVIGVDLAISGALIRTTRAPHQALARESVMGIFSWFGSRKSATKRGRHRSGQRVVDPGGPPSLVRLNVESPELQEIEDAAAADVARVREDDKYFGRDSPANDDGF